MALKQLLFRLSLAVAITTIFAGNEAAAQTRAGRTRESIHETVRSIQARLPVRLEDPAPSGLIDPRSVAFARGRTFVAYPGAPGIQVDVFTQNFETLHRDFGVPLDRLIYRDPLGFHARYGNDARGSAGVRPPGTTIIRDTAYLGANRLCGQNPGSAARVAAQEAAFLKAVRDEFGLPVVVLCHSATCATTLTGVLATNYARAGAPIVDSFFFMQGYPTTPRNIQSVVNSINEGLGRSGRFAQDGCALDGPIVDNARALAQARAFFVADGGPNGGASHNDFAPVGYGRYLGPLGVSHIDAVVSSPRSTKPPSFRRALMHALLGVATE